MVMSARTSEAPSESHQSERGSAPATRESSHAPRELGDDLAVEESASQDPEGPSNPPLPLEVPPPLPNEAPPGQVPDDGWDPVWDENAQAFYFYNRFTEISQWENPRIPSATESTPADVGNHDRLQSPPGHKSSDPASGRSAGGYDPAIHGNYDPNADYAKVHQESVGGGDDQASGAADSADAYAATGSFNRFTGKWQATTLNPENFNDENKSRRQMNAYFDVDSAANSHDGKSLKAERSGKKLSKREIKAFKDKRRERKEEKRRAWLRD